MAQALEPRASGSGAVSFELERLGHTATGRLELSGRWFGVRGRRFMRPTLTFEADGQPHRLLADLEHKPWLAEDGGPWVAAFAWGSDPAALTEIELSVAPDITIPLSGKDGPRSGSHRRQQAGAETRSASLARELQEVRRKLAEELRTTEELHAELAPLRSELETARSQLERLQEEQIEGEATLARRDAALARLSAVETERDNNRRALEQAEAEREELRRAYRRAVAERDKALAALEREHTERDLAARAGQRAIEDRQNALQARDKALIERDHALAEREQLARAGDSFEAQRAAARALVTRRNLAWRPSPWSGTSRRGARSSPDILRREIGWPGRIFAIALLIAAVVALVVILHVL